MDEQRLNRLFRDAVGDLPPASFGVDEVVAASRRATTVRRNTLLGGALLSVGVLAGTLVAGDLVSEGWPPDRGSSGRQPAPQTATPGPEPGGMHPFSGLPESPRPAPRADSASRGGTSCGPFDQELAAELTALLTEHGTPPSGPAGEVPGEQCSAGSRAAAVPVSGGVLYVVLAPRANLNEPVQTTAPDGSRSHAVPLEQGQLVVISVPTAPGQPTPLAGDLPALVEELASHR